MSDPTAPPPPPPVRRLNRGVWIVFAVIALVTVCVIAFLLAPRRDKALRPLPARPLTGSEPGFLHHPPGEIPPAPPTPSEQDYLRSLLDRQAGAGPGRLGAPASVPPGPPLEALPAPPPPAPAAATPAAPPSDPRREAYLRALEAPLSRASTPPAAAAPAAASPPWLIPPNPSWQPSAPPTPTELPTSTRTPSRAAGAGTVFGAGSLQEVAEQPARFHAPPATATVPAGTVIPASLITEVNSDLPGNLLAQVSRNVYDAQQAMILIPQGARLLGRYDSQIAVGQRRLLVAWTRLVFPDGSAWDLPGLPGTSAAGAAGVGAHVQNHLLRLLGDAILLSLFSAGAQLSQPQPTGFGTLPSSGNVAAAALGQELSSVGLQLLRRDMGIQPTLQIAPATPFLVFVNGDLELRRPHLSGDPSLDPR